MKFEAEQVLCRFHLANTIHCGAQPLYEWIVHVARREGLQGATVLRGFYGMEQEGPLLRTRSWTPTQRLPVIVEVVDESSRIEGLLARVESKFVDGIITLERAHVVLYRAGARETASQLHDRHVLATTNASAAIGVRTMKAAEDGVLLRVFIGESDRDPDGDRPLYEAIVRRAREAGLAGATVLRGPMGFGRHSLVHAAKVLELSTDLPIVIEIVDSEDRIERFLPIVDQLVAEGLVTLEAVRILKYVSPEER